MKKYFMDTMKKSSFYIILFIMIVTCSAIDTYAAGQNKPVKVSKRDRKAIEQTVNKLYGPGYKIRIKPAEQTTDNEIYNRKGKGIVYVDLFVTRSKGNYGKVTTPGPFKGRIIKYFRHIKRGKTVNVYNIYNPNTNSDELDVVVINGKVKIY